MRSSKSDIYRIVHERSIETCRSWNKTATNSITDRIWIEGNICETNVFLSFGNISMYCLFSIFCHLLFILFIKFSWNCMKASKNLIHKMLNFFSSFLFQNCMNTSSIILYSLDFYLHYFFHSIDFLSMASFLIFFFSIFGHF